MLRGTIIERVCGVWPVGVWLSSRSSHHVGMLTDDLDRSDVTIPSVDRFDLFSLSSRTIESTFLIVWQLGQLLRSFVSQFHSKIAYVLVTGIIS